MYSSNNMNNTINMNNTNNMNNDKLVTKFDWKRTILNADYKKQLNTAPPYQDINILGFIIFIIIFGMYIPHLLFKKKWHIVLISYFCNLDMVATVLGFSGGPFNMWKYLYNPESTTLLGFIFSTLINYLAISGVGFICILYAMHHKSEYSGLARLLIAVPITYLFPGNFIVFFMNNFASFLFKHHISYYMRWFLTLCFGVLYATSIIYFEQLITKHFSKYMASFFYKIANQY